jgi:hypothetical protein
MSTLDARTALGTDTAAAAPPRTGARWACILGEIGALLAAVTVVIGVFAMVQGLTPLRFLAAEPFAATMLGFRMSALVSLAVVLLAGAAGARVGSRESMRNRVLDVPATAQGWWAVGLGLVATIGIETLADAGGAWTGVVLVLGLTVAGIAAIVAAAFAVVGAVRDGERSAAVLLATVPALMMLWFTIAELFQSVG